MSETGRAAERQQFLDRAGWGSANMEALRQDASFRRYFRLTNAKKDAPSTSLLMDAPRPQENIDAYLDITALLRGYGLRVPQIFAEDRATGFAVIEDFGHGTFTCLLEDGVDDTKLYGAAVDALVRLHSSPQSTGDLPPYDMERLCAEVSLFVDWFVPAMRGTTVTEAERSAFMAAWQQVLGDAALRRETLVLRDYHVDNLMVVDNRFDVDHCGLLDYQDALLGMRAYDLVSLLEDERRDVGSVLREQMVTRYLTGLAAAGISVDRAALEADMQLLGTQRKIKVAGIFVRLAERDGKKQYLQHMPRILRLLEAGLRSEALAPVAEVVHGLVPDYIKRPLSIA